MRPATPPRGSRGQRVLVATAGRDRVLDAVKAFALLAVVVGHSLAWTISPTGSPENVLESAPALIVLTWVFQVLPLFFAAGAVSNAQSFEAHRSRANGSGAFLKRRTRRLLTPVLVYVAFWTVALLALGRVVSIAENETVNAGGTFLAELLWFAGTYLLVVCAVPLTQRWRSRPAPTLLAWACAVAIIDALRITGAAEAMTWLNLLLVWGWLHQLGYELPRLRRQPVAGLVAVGLALWGTAVCLAAVGPYSMSLVSIGSDDELSNLAPPSMVLLLYGAGQIILLAAGWRSIERLLSRDRVWVSVALFGGRGMGVYLWHIPLVGLSVLLVIAIGWRPPPLTVAWWGLHLAVVALVVPGAWAIAGWAGWVERRFSGAPCTIPMPAGVAGVLGGLIVLNISVTGFAAFLGFGALGVPSSAALNLLILVLAWQSTGRRRRTPQKA